MSEALEFDREARRQHVLDAFGEKGDFPAIMDAGTLGRLVDAAIALDEAYMTESGALDGGVYDDDAAYEYMLSGLSEAFPDYRRYMMRFVEDYMEYNEAFLEEQGLIDWD
ncbi:MAG: hypothetical protein Q4C13_09350 [Clostridia bacterium]|nr:hypothetical protein [Clostridia bacterium]